MSMNLTPEEIDLLDRFAGESLSGLNSDPECRLNPLESADVAYDDALAMIARRRLVLAEHAAPAVKDSLTAQLPADIPPPPEGFVLYGMGPLNSTADFHEQSDVAGYRDVSGWNIGRVGVWSAIHYALRAGSDIARRNGLEGGAR